MNKEHSRIPFMFRKVGQSDLIVNELGQWGLFPNKTVGQLLDNDCLNNEKLTSLGLTQSSTSWQLESAKIQILKKYRKKSEKISYLILVPTLRCNLSCNYCQVSRAHENAKGFDWGEEELRLFAEFVNKNCSKNLKIEFQGGEPTLRIDLIRKIIKIVKGNTDLSEFVICTNMVNLSNELLELVESENLTISTSIDGPKETMTINRTAEDVISEKILCNIKDVIDRFGHSKISALPTITEAQRKDPETLINYYFDLGFSSIFLRPVNFQGFARKKHKDISNQINEWNAFYNKCLEIIRTKNSERYFEEYYLASILRNIFLNADSGYVDFKSPSKYCQNYCVIDFDGTIYPTDESRMLTRTRTIDLAVGSLKDGLDTEFIKSLDYNGIHQTHSDCIHCTYHPFCGIDMVDDFSRHQRLDLPKRKTWFCNRQINIFDFIFMQIEAKNIPWTSTFLDWIFKSKKHSNPVELFYD